MIQWVRSLVFLGVAYFMMLVVGVVYAPWVIMNPRKGANAGCKAWCDWVTWSAKWMVGLRCEIRGEPPTEPCLIAAKHQSFLDAILIFRHVPAGRYIMKDSLRYAPILGQYALALGCIPVKRGQRSKAIRQMKAQVADGKGELGQVMIYPQGTRVAPGESAPYKVGTAVLYQELAQPCYPVACNVGLFWPKYGIMRHPGTAVVEFLPPIPVGLDNGALMERLESEIEAASDRLAREARG